MTCREVICNKCQHQYRTILRADNQIRVRSKQGKVIKVDLSQCPQCHTFQFLSKDSLVGLNEDDYEELEWRL